MVKGWLLFGGTKRIDQHEHAFAVWLLFQVPKLLRVSDPVRSDSLVENETAEFLAKAVGTVVVGFGSLGADQERRKQENPTQMFLHGASITQRGRERKGEMGSLEFGGQVRVRGQGQGRWRVRGRWRGRWRWRWRGQVQVQVQVQGQGQGQGRWRWRWRGQVQGRGRW